MAGELDEFLDSLRRSGLLVEFSADQWDAYARKHFGTDSAITFGPPAFVEPAADSQDVRWREPQRREFPRNAHEDPSDWDDGK